MHYRGIVDNHDVDWYDAVLKQYSTLEVNDFLHDISPYVTNRPLPPFHAAATSGSQGAPSTSAPLVRLVETEIFHDSHERRRPQYPDTSGDELYMGTSFGQGGGGFNQFGSMERALSGSDFLSNPGPSVFHGTKLISSVEDTSHNSGETLVHPDPLISRIALGFRGSCREGGARCVHWPDQ
jgi:hypothetical protein